MSPVRRVLLVAGLTALTVPFAAPALAASGYSVKLKVPSLVSGTQFKVSASGSSTNQAQLTVYLSTKSCPASAKAAAAAGARRVIKHGVKGNYAASKTVRSGGTGAYHACGYVTTGSSTRAHASKGYDVLSGSY